MGKLLPQGGLCQKAKLFTESRHCIPKHAHRNIPPPCEAARAGKPDSGVLFPQHEAPEWDVRVRDGTGRGTPQGAQLRAEG